MTQDEMRHKVTQKEWQWVMQVSCVRWVGVMTHEWWKIENWNWSPMTLERIIGYSHGVRYVYDFVS